MGRVLNRKGKAGTDAEYQWAEVQEKELREWNNAIAKVVAYAIKTETVSGFAKKIQYSRSTLCTLLKQDTRKKQRPWTLDTLIAISREIGCTLPELFTAAEAVKNTPGGTPSLSLRLCGTAPHSKERLQRLIYEAVDYDGDYDASHVDGLLEVEYRVKHIECGSPEFVRRYYSGEMSDAKALAVLKEAEAARYHENEGYYPLWAALREIYKE